MKHHEEDYSHLIGKKVKKVSGKPFKSSLKINTVAFICFKPQLQRQCFCFHEDDSFVECFRCEEVKS
jgi:hypothetical protein